MKADVPANVVRICFCIVFLWNIQCALSFILFPESYAVSYQLEGVPGCAAVQGIGVAFLMWNATYPPFIFSPDKFKALGVMIIVQQLIGLVGESYILLSLPHGFAILASSIERFIVFDGIGLLLMVISFIVLAVFRRKRHAFEGVDKTEG